MSKNIFLLRRFNQEVAKGNIHSAQKILDRCRNPFTSAQVMNERLEDLMFNAVRNGDTEKVKSFLDFGFSTDTVDFWGSSALHIAVKQGSLAIVELLMSRGAKVNSLDDHWSTPLDLATLFKRAEISAFLKQHGAKRFEELCPKRSD
ncbi:MAG: ankyrin repeat domain-containing protein [Candidatus ainarchaeum sp.]|nr:ankyrin repeat domain-containing protein [Candidatus ainarchaeum sp.]